MVVESSSAAAPAGAVGPAECARVVGVEAGLGARVEGAVSLLSSVLAELDPDRIPGADATALYGSICRAERLVLAGKALLSARIEWSGIWQLFGHPDAATLLADVEGVSPGQARATLAVGRRLSFLPGTEAVLRDGVLSGPKARELTRAGMADPAREEELLAGAASEPLAVVTERCRAARASAAGADPVRALTAIHAERRFSSWTDAEGAFCYEGRDTPDRGATLLSHLGPMATALRRARRKEGEGSEPEAALRADALVALVCGHTVCGNTVCENTVCGNTSPTSAGPGEDPTGPEAPTTLERPPPTTVLVRVDLEALLRGEALPGEVCELEGVGPVPVTMARQLASDAFLTLCYHRAGEISAVSNLGRTIKATLRTALFERDRHCVVPGCMATRALEIDHLVPFAEGGPTELDNLALLCHHHHFLKTYEGWALTRTGTTQTGAPMWSFASQPPFGQEPGLGIDTPEGRADWHRCQERFRAQQE
jgi:Domain of unknown function (DUF222)/HNH endonuclease